MSIKIIRSELFKKFPELIFGFSTKIGGYSEGDFDLNLSISVGDDPVNVAKNRKIFFDELGIKEEQVTFQKQIHSANINYSPNPGHFDDSDAIFTDQKNNFLAISVADCIPVFLFDKKKKVVAGIHSGWKGTKEKIVSKTILMLKDKFSSDPKDIIAFIGPGISGEKYEVGREVAEHFEEEFKTKGNNNKYYLDLKKNNLHQLLAVGVNEENIEISELCTFSEKDLHSYRRDGTGSGRMFGIIGLRA